MNPSSVVSGYVSHRLYCLPLSRLANSLRFPLRIYLLRRLARLRWPLVGNVLPSALALPIARRLARGDSFSRSRSAASSRSRRTLRAIAPS